MASSAILLCMLAGLSGLGCADQRSKTVGGTVTFKDDSNVNSSHLVTRLDADTIRNPSSYRPDQKHRVQNNRQDQKIPGGKLPNQTPSARNLPGEKRLDAKLPEQNLPIQNLHDVKLPEQNLPMQNLHDVKLPEQNLPMQNLHDVKLPEQNLPMQNLHDVKLPEQNLPDQNFPDEKSRQYGDSIPYQIRSKDADSRETKSRKMSLSPKNLDVLLNSTPNGSTTTDNRTHNRTTATHAQNLNKLPNHNLDAPSFRKVTDTADSTANKTREFLRGKQMIDDREFWNALHRGLLRELRIPIAATDRKERRVYINNDQLNQGQATVTRPAERFDEKRQRERKRFKTFVEKLLFKYEELVTNYKALRDDESSTRSNLTIVNVLRSTWPLLAEYEPWKKGEFEIDSYLKGTKKERDEYDTWRKAESEIDSNLRGTKEEKKPAEKTEDHIHNEIEAVAEDQAQATKSRVEEALSHAKERRHRRQIRSTDNTLAMKESSSVMQSLLDRLPDVLRNKMATTDDIELEILNLCVASKNFGNKEVGVYTMAKKNERELLKRILKEAGPYYGQKILQIYKLIRRGEPWNYVKLNKTYEKFFKKPSATLKAYDDLKRDEVASLDAFLSGPNRELAAGQNEETEVWKMDRKGKAEEEKMNLMGKEEEEETNLMEKQEQEETNIMGKEDEEETNLMGKEEQEETNIMGKEEQEETNLMGKEEQEETNIMGKAEEGKMYRKGKVEEGKMYRKGKAEKEGEMEEEEKREELNRRVRAKVAEISKVEEMTRMETAGNHDEAITPDAGGGTDEVVGRSDNHPTAHHGRRHTSATLTSKKTSDRKSFIGMAILLSVFINAILAIVVLGLYRKELLVWYRRRTLGKGEAEPLRHHILRGIRSSSTYI